jgi:hypothetical protein
MRRASITRAATVRRALHGLFAAALALGLLSSGPRALADEPSANGSRQVTLTWAPLPTPVPLVAGEPTGDGDALPPSIAVLPLRLSLLDAAYPLVPPCSGGDPISSAAPVFPVQRHTFFALIPHLVLHGFSSGCTSVNTGVGGGVTYAAPIAKNWWIMGSAGTYAVQWLRANQPASLQQVTDARVDVVFRLSSDRALSLGVGRRGLSFSGAW